MKTTDIIDDDPEDYAETLEEAGIILIPVPYDATSTWQKGADDGPDAFLEALEHVEWYDIETDSEVWKEGIFLADPVEIDNEADPKSMVRTVHEITKEYINTGKFVTIIGGEHSISIGTIRAFNECFDNVSVLQIDAHADLRKKYQGSKFNHACAVFEASKKTNLVQVGIRSMCVSEKKEINPEKVFFAHDIKDDDDWMDQAIELLSDNVFITFDFDALDPSIFPSTGTPEPGGMHYYQTIKFLRKVFLSKNVIGFDMMELCPKEHDVSSDLLAAKLYYKMLSYKFCMNQ